ncbi:MAG: type II toxin-antitoxin system Phd/YefM family antitoxin [Ktedonobacteraceae bacterium]|nr:type II toxin-antitoxin system Phd/YefM family antitoxin [Ktedonobacteraceae bacterium]
MVEHTISISEVQSKITRLPEQFDEDPEAVTVTRHGKPVMAILPFTAYTALLEAVEALQETLEVLSDEETMVVFGESVKDLAEGRVEPLDAALKGLGWE